MINKTIDTFINGMIESWFSLPFVKDPIYDTVKEFTTTVNNRETKVKIFFDKEGRVVAAKYSNTYVPSEKERELNEVISKMKEALEKEDFIEASKLKIKRDQLLHEIKNQ